MQTQPCGPEDDTSWMTGGAADLEAELAQRQKELEADMAKRAKQTAQGLSGSDTSRPEFDPTDVVTRMKVYIMQRKCIDVLLVVVAFGFCLTHHCMQIRTRVEADTNMSVLAKPQLFLVASALCMHHVVM